MTTTLPTVYGRYLDCLNDRRWDDLGEFVCDDVHYNGQRIGLVGYRSMLQHDVDTIPDLQFTATLLVADDATVGCRLLFHCTPEREFLGWSPTGSAITFAEHVFYRFRAAKIAEVFSLLDTEAIAAQLQSS
ncbi:ester cyclase [Mycolicibacterium mengxianglii]|uniref:ester cyclase n=1 Tax=Mycolicibacterium mengxianglii TaxID=2736649 RepID=UPI0018D18D42|nr:ester cyclase [Mycolicibacterium mengxianglii]